MDVTFGDDIKAALRENGPEVDAAMKALADAINADIESVETETSADEMLASIQVEANKDTEPEEPAEVEEPE